ncbi:MAG: LacI family DNA-binding transcriptional regulator [Clostridiales bacterium]
MKETNSKKYEILRDKLLDFIRDNNLQPNDKLPTVRDIINDSEFSYATVNRTLLEMEKEGYITKKQGKGLFVNRIGPVVKNRQIALIIPKDFSNHKMFLNILSGIHPVVEQSKIGLLVSISNMNHEKEKETVEMLISKQIDGFIIFLEDHYREDYSHIIELKEKNFPFVLIDRFIPELDTDYVVINNKDTMFRICSFLKYNKQCDKIVYIRDTDSRDDISSSEEKLSGFFDAIKILYTGQEPSVMAPNELVNSLAGLTTKYHNLGICFNHDNLVVNFYETLEARGIEIPKNIHVFGYNNSFDAVHFPTVEQYNNKVGEAAAEILMNKLENPSAETKHIRIEPKLILPDGHGGYFEEA